MRRLMGGWLLFLLVLLTKVGPVTQKTTYGGGSHLVDSAPSTAASVPAPASAGEFSLPGAYKKNPLHFFSTAPRDSLMALPGIGPVLADRIVNARGGKRLFNAWDDLLRVKGIGAKTVAKLKRLAGEADGS